MLRTALTIVLTLLVTNVFAWGRGGHQVVAGLAAVQLSVKARAEVDRLLALEPGQTLQSISTWADEHRSPATSHWHYLNFPRDACGYDAARDCPAGNCVIAVIDKQLDVLASKAPDDAKLTALKYVIELTKYTDRITLAQMSKVAATADS